MSIDRATAERVGPRFDLATLLDARRRTIAAVGDIGRRVAPGMVEEDALALARHILRHHGLATIGPRHTCASASTP